MIRVPVNPKLLRWARKRAEMTQKDLTAKFRHLTEWENGKKLPTLKQLESFARAVHVPFGYLFFREPPEEHLPISDFRTITDKTSTRPSPNLLDTIYACQERQSWYRDFSRMADEPELDFIGSVSVETPPEIVAKRIQNTFGFGLAARQKCPTWTDALCLLIHKVDKAGVLVMASDTVKSDTTRPLDPTEFRSFSLCDSRAPLIFINDTDTKDLKMVALVHELAHLWLGASALSNHGVKSSNEFHREEVWCNTVAMEFLVPLDALQSDLRQNEPLVDTLSRLKQIYKVSTLVILVRLLDVGCLTRKNFETAWAQETERLGDLAQTNSTDGNICRTTIEHVGRRFSRALVANTLEGQTLYRDAFRMLGIKKTEAFNNIGREIGVIV